MTTPGDYPPPSDPSGGYGPGGYGAPQQENNTPKVLGIVGIICAILCWPAGIVLGLIGQSKAREYGQSDTLPKVAWIIAIVVGVINILFTVLRYAH